LVDVLDNGVRRYSYRYLSGAQLFVSVMAQDLLADEKFSHAVVKRGNYFATNLRGNRADRGRWRRNA
jgi:hypothetical protein